MNKIRKDIGIPVGSKINLCSETLFLETPYLRTETYVFKLIEVISPGAICGPQKLCLAGISRFVFHFGFHFGQ